jgi:uncharacterized membrane protein YgaE (UPF0421/DUF939 family)
MRHGEDWIGWPILVIGLAIGVVVYIVSWFIKLAIGG